MNKYVNVIITECLQSNDVDIQDPLVMMTSPALLVNFQRSSPSEAYRFLVFI